MPLTAPQLRAARALLDIGQEELAERSGVGVDTIKKFENGHTKRLQEKTENDIIRALHDSVDFIDNHGVRLKPSGIEIFEGPERFHDFTETVYEYLARNGGEVCISAVDETQFQKYRKDVDLYRQRMTDLVKRGGVRVRILAGRSQFISAFAEVRRLPQQKSSAPTAFYTFGDCLALISFEHDNPPYVVLHRSSLFAAAYRRAFEAEWNSAEKI